MTLAGWKRPPGTDAPPTSSVSPLSNPTTTLASSPTASPANDFVKAELDNSSFNLPADLGFTSPAVADVPEEIEPPRPLVGKNTLAAAQDLERALAELDGPGAALLRGAPATPELVASAFESATVIDAAPTPFGASVAPSAPIAFGAPNPAPVAFGDAAPNDDPVAPAAFASMSPTSSPAAFGTAPIGSPQAPWEPQMDSGSHASTSLVPPASAPPVFVPPVFAPAAVAVPGTVQFAPGVGAVPPAFTKGESSTGKTVGIVIAIVIGVMLLISVMIIGAVSLLSQKVNASFNSIGTMPTMPTISNTLPGFSSDPYSMDAYTSDPYAADPYGTDPNGGGSSASSQLDAELTVFERTSGVPGAMLFGRNTDGPVKFTAGEGCVIFEPNTMSYGAFLCSGSYLNARLVISGPLAEISQSCQAVASERDGAPVDVLSLWIVDYANGEAECFIRTPDWRIETPADRDLGAGEISSTLP